MSSAFSTIHREHRPGFDCTEVRQGAVIEFHLSFYPLPGENVMGLVGRMRSALEEREATVVKAEVFGALSSVGPFETALMNGNTARWPITWIEGGSCEGLPIAGVHIFAMAGAEMQVICLRGEPVGTYFDISGIRHCWLGGLRSANTQESASSQAAKLYEDMEGILSTIGLNLRNLVRTWFFLDQITSWYGKFNEVRNNVYVQRRLLEGLVPASTGIGACNPSGSAIIAGAWAIKTPTNVPGAIRVDSPLQCPAPQYGSCFSRAIEVSGPSARTLSISGTASIEPGGRSVYPDDMQKQIDLTMEVVDAILKSRQMAFRDTTRATAYIKRIEDGEVFRQWCQQHSLGLLPAIVTRSDVCRDELLFEIELDAIVSTPFVKSDFDEKKDLPK